MPGKVNPVMCEMAMQVSAQIIGNDAAITFGAASGNFELNTMMPVIANNLLLSVELLANGSRVFAERCIIGIEADIDRCKANVEQSLALSTALAPAIGYDKASHIAKIAFDTGRTIRSVASEISGIDDTSLNRLLDPKRQTGG